MVGISEFQSIIFLLVLALIWIIFATFQDLRKREIANWLNFSLIIFALGFRFFYSLFSLDNFSFFYQGILGLGIFFLLGNILYYGRMFAGGDAKLMMALGVVLPFSNDFLINIRIFVLFFLAFVFIGGIYGLTLSFILMFKNFDKFKKEFKKQFNKNKKKINMIFFLALVFLAVGIFNDLLFLLGTFIFLTPYLYLATKSIDEAVMIRKTKPEDLAEGDWLYRNVKVGKKTIKSSWEGLSEKDIKLLKKKKKNVLIRQGIPFAPVFLFSFLVIVYTYFFNNILWNSIW